MVETLSPSKSKTWIALAGSLLSVAVPLLITASDHLPAPWPAVIGGVIALLTATGVYRAPYMPKGSVLTPSTTQSGGYKNPWSM